MSLIPQLRSRIHTNWISSIRDNSWNSCRAFVYFMSTRESQQLDNAARFRYRRGSQRYEQFPRAITIDSFAEIDERPARQRFRSSQVAPQYPPATACPARLPAIDERNRTTPRYLAYGKYALIGSGRDRGTSKP